jgi:hypothetical protein
LCPLTLKIDVDGKQKYIRISSESYRDNARAKTLLLASDQVLNNKKERIPITEGIFEL